VGFQRNATTVLGATNLGTTTSHGAGKQQVPPLRVAGAPAPVGMTSIFDGCQTQCQSQGQDPGSGQECSS